MICKLCGFNGMGRYVPVLENKRNPVEDEWFCWRCFEDKIRKEDFRKMIVLSYLFLAACLVAIVLIYK